MDSVPVLLLALSASSLLLSVILRRRVGIWSGTAMTCVVGSAVVPDGAYRWTLLGLGVATLVMGLAKVPRAAWQRYRVLVGLFVCFAVTILASEVFDLNSSGVLWVIGILAGLFIAVAVFSAVRVIRSGRANAGLSPSPKSSPRGQG